MRARYEASVVTPVVTPVVPTATGRGKISTQGRGMHQTSLGGWYTNTNNNIDPLHKDSLQLLTTELTSAGLDDAALQHNATIEQVKSTRKVRVLEANGTRTPSLTPSQRVGAGGQDIISFEYININGINAHDNFAELTNAIGILATIEE